MSAENPFPEIKAVERQEFEKLNNYLKGLDRDGWLETSYCTDWPVLSVVSHVGSASRIGKSRLESWVNGAPAMPREEMLALWAKFDSLTPDNMMHEYMSAVGEYLAAESSIADEEGAKEVEGFGGKRPIWAYQLGRLWELALHSWDVMVTRDKNAKIAQGAVDLIAPRMNYMGATMDRARISETPHVQFNMQGPNATCHVDASGERPRLAPGEDAEATVVIEGPAEEVVRFLAGRHAVVGAKPTLRAAKGSRDDVAKVRRAFR